MARGQGRGGKGTIVPHARAIARNSKFGPFSGSDNQATEKKYFSLHS